MRIYISTKKYINYETVFENPTNCETLSMSCACLPRTFKMLIFPYLRYADDQRGDPSSAEDFIRSGSQNDGQEELNRRAFISNYVCIVFTICYLL